MHNGIMNSLDHHGTLQTDCVSVQQGNDNMSRQSLHNVARHECDRTARTYRHPHIMLIWAAMSHTSRPHKALTSVAAVRLARLPLDTNSSSSGAGRLAAESANEVLMCESYAITSPSSAAAWCTLNGLPPPR